MPDARIGAQPPRYSFLLNSEAEVNRLIDGAGADGDVGRPHLVLGTLDPKIGESLCRPLTTARASANTEASANGIYGADARVRGM